MLSFYSYVSGSRSLAKNVCWRCALRGRSIRGAFTLSNRSQTSQKRSQQVNKTSPSATPLVPFKNPKAYKPPGGEKCLDNNPQNDAAPNSIIRYEPTKHHERRNVIPAGTVVRRRSTRRGLIPKHYGGKELVVRRPSGEFERTEHYIVQEDTFLSKSNASLTHDLEEPPNALSDQCSDAEVSDEVECTQKKVDAVSNSSNESWLALIQDEVKNKTKLAQQQRLEKSLLEGDSRGSKGLTQRSIKAPSAANSQIMRISRRLFSSQSQAEPVRNYATVASDIDFGLLQSPTREGYNSDVRKDLRSWQSKHVAEEPDSKAQLGISAPPFSRGIASHGEDSVNEQDDLRDMYEPTLDGDAEREAVTSSLALQAGDLVELLSDNECLLAVFVKRFPNQLQLFTQYGRWIHVPGNRRWYFRVPSFCQTDELKPIIPFLPSLEVPVPQLGRLNGSMSTVPFESGQALVHRMSDFIRQADIIYRQRAARIDNAYELLAHERQLTWMTIDEIAKRVLELNTSESTPASTLWAVHRAIILFQVGFIPDNMNHWSSGTFEILPRQDLDLVNQIKAWVREHQEYCISQMQEDNSGLTQKSQQKPSMLTNFAKKIAPIIQKSRSFRPLNPSGYIGPSSVQIEPNPLAFQSVPIRAAEPSETLILRFLELWSARRSARKGSELWALGPMILRATGVYKDKDLAQLDQNIGFNFLQEAGVVAPWETQISFDSRLALPGSNFDIKLDKLLVTASENAQNLDLVDSMADLRKDWGGLEVFCIDAESTQEIDDGFSLEKIPGHDDAFWIHIHIANPTAYIPPDHPIALYAERLTSSLYYPGKIYSMISPNITNAHFSLREGRPVLTFSAKLSTDGRILESQITPGRIHNVTFLTPETANKMLASRASNMFSSIRRYTVGKTPPSGSVGPSRKVVDSLTSGQYEQLRVLQKLGLAHRILRKSSTPMDPQLRFLSILDARMGQYKYPEPNVWYSQMEYPWRRVLRRIEGDPTIGYRTQMFEPQFTIGADVDHALEFTSLVEDIMVLAGEVAGEWCNARGIPILFRGTQENNSIIPQETLDRWKRASEPGQSGEFIYLAALQFGMARSKPLIMTRAVRHDSMAVDAYTKATSPMRRFTDMVAHWQIEAALRAEARLGRALTEMDFPSLPFSRERLQNMASYIAQREGIVKRSESITKTHWCSMMIMRSHHFKEPLYPDPLPETLEAFFIRRDAYVWQGKIKELNLPCLVHIDPHANPNVKYMAEGDWWNVRISKANASQILDVKPLHLISRIDG